jgi:tRNA(fMet)-specific endonuclease VapC
LTGNLLDTNIVSDLIHNPGGRVARRVRDVGEGGVEILPFEAPADAVYGQIRYQLEQTGRLIGGNDLLIAAQAMVLGRTIVTDNEREFARVASLPRENWLRDT